MKGARPRPWHNAAPGCARLALWSAAANPAAARGKARPVGPQSAARPSSPGPARSAGGPGHGRGVAWTSLLSLLLLKSPVFNQRIIVLFWYLACLSRSGMSTKYPQEDPQDRSHLCREGVAEEG